LSEGGSQLRAALYARVSTEDQAKEGFSIAAQLKRLESYCKARGWELTDRYIDDGHSGREVNRPAYQRMMVERDLWDVLVVLKMDRIHRNSKNFTLMMDDLREWEKEFNSMQESFDTTTAMGRFVMDIIQRIAQLESEQIGERVKFGMTQKARRGNGYLGSGHPYGYSYKNGGLAIIEEEANIANDIFRRYLDGMSLREIADSLNHHGVPSKTGKEWSKQVISKILKNPLYCGFIRWDGILRQGEHDPIISREVFNRVQIRMRRGIRNRERLGELTLVEQEMGEIGV
jgi:site-specific DNA recombinase